MEGGLHDVRVTHLEECSMIPVAEDPRGDGLLIRAGRQMMIALTTLILGGGERGGKGGKGSRKSFRLCSWA